MSINLTLKAKKLLDLQLRKAANEAETYMWNVAPSPGGKTPNQYNYSTGATRSSIRKHKIGFWEWEIAPTTPHAYFADQGRKEIKGKWMKFYSKKARREICTTHVAKMNGWDFIHKTAEHIRRTYGY